jgi:hypothetical protein
MVQVVWNMGKRPIVPAYTWGRRANIQKCAPELKPNNDDLYRAFPQIMKAPDFWPFIQRKGIYTWQQF